MDADVARVGEEGGTVGLLQNEGGRKQVVSHQLWLTPWLKSLPWKQM